MGRSCGGSVNEELADSTVDDGLPLSVGRRFTTLRSFAEAVAGRGRRRQPSRRTRRPPLKNELAADGGIPRMCAGGVGGLGLAGLVGAARGAVAHGQRGGAARWPTRVTVPTILRPEHCRLIGAEPRPRAAVEGVVELQLLVGALHRALCRPGPGVGLDRRGLRAPLSRQWDGQRTAKLHRNTAHGTTGTRKHDALQCNSTASCR